MRTHTCSSFKQTEHTRGGDCPPQSPPLVCSVCLNELQVCVRMRMRMGVCGYACDAGSGVAGGVGSRHVQRAKHGQHAVGVHAGGARTSIPPRIGHDLGGCLELRWTSSGSGGKPPSSGGGGGTKGRPLPPRTFQGHKRTLRFCLWKVCVYYCRKVEDGGRAPHPDEG
jgi:hypothetical protein